MNTLMKKHTKTFKEVLATAIISLLMFVLVSTSYAASMSVTPPQLTYYDISIGNTYILEDMNPNNIKIKFTYTGNDNEPMVVEAVRSGVTLPAGYTILPENISVTITPNNFIINDSESKEISVSLDIPQNIDYLGKKFAFGIWGYTTTGSGRAAAIATVYLEINPLYINFGIAGYEELTTIGLIGNKAVISANIATAPGSSAPTVKLYYRKTGNDAWGAQDPSNTNPAAKSDGTKDFSFEVAASSITTAGFQYIIESNAGTAYAYSPVQGRAEFLATANTKYHNVTVSRTTTGQIATTGSTLSVPDGNPQDGAVKIVAPRGAVATNQTITLQQIDAINDASCPPTPGFALSEKPAMIFNLTPENTRFLKNIDLTLLYFDLNNDGVVDDLLDQDGAPIEEAKLKMFWWDGFKWRLVNGAQNQDIEKNTITVKTNHFSYYALIPVNSLRPEDYRPAKKIITPNGDGINDEADFSGLGEEIKIFDITGRKIRTVSAGTGEWDGKDNDGSIVESGVYIYQFKVDGTLVSGVIAVAK